MYLWALFTGGCEPPDVAGNWTQVSMEEYYVPVLLAAEPSLQSVETVLKLDVGVPGSLLISGFPWSEIM